MAGRSRQPADPLEELLDRASHLSLEGQTALLMIAQGMSYSHHCHPQMVQQEKTRESAKEQETQEEGSP